jgi:N-acetylglutamate synthase-like GNAT family acetyltransferase
MIIFGDLLDMIESKPEDLGIIKQSYMSLLNEPILITDEQFQTQVKKISTYGSIIIAYKKEENNEMEFAAIVTLIIEPKISLTNKCVGHIENMVILDKYKKSTLQKELLERIKKLARSWNCDRMVLSCLTRDKTKYEKLGFNESSIQMSYQLEDKNEFDDVINNISITALEPSCAHCLNIIQRNSFVSYDGSKKTNLFLYFNSIKDSDNFDENIEKNKILELLREKKIEGSQALVIMHVVDLMQKYKIVSGNDVSFIYISTISGFNGSEFEWKKDNEFLDKILNEKLMHFFIIRP